MRNPTKYLRRWVSRRSGRYALQVAGTVGCRVVGVDISEPGIQTANQLATALNVSAQLRFESCDVFSGQAQLMRKQARSRGPKLLQVHFGNTVDRPLLRIARFSSNRLKTLNSSTLADLSGLILPSNSNSFRFADKPLVIRVLRMAESGSRILSKKR
jgi:hypothetical protein